MWKKIIPNTLYTIGIVICFIIGYQNGIENKQYWYIVGAVILIAIFMVLKVRILKEIKNTQKKP
jgi:hypothetical protein